MEFVLYFYYKKDGCYKKQGSERFNLSHDLVKNDIGKIIYTGNSYENQNVNVDRESDEEKLSEYEEEIEALPSSSWESLAQLFQQQ